MKKKSLLTLMAATTAFSGVAVVSQPNDAEAATSAKSLVVKAEKSAQKLAAEINYDKRKKLYPKSPVGLPNAKLYKETKAAYNKALAAVKKTKANEKKVLQARLDQKVKLTLDRTAKYITAVNAGKKLLTESKSLEKNVKAYKLDSKTKKSYEALSADYAKLSKQINSVYGSSTRISLNKAYTYKITPTYTKARFAFSFKSNTDEISKAIKDGDYTKAQSYIERANKLIADNKKYKYANVTTTLYKKLIAAYNPLVAQLNDKVTTYMAISKDASKPTQFGGTESKPVTINHDVILVAGEGKYIKLQNVVVNGSIIIKGDTTGAGTVTLDNVKVNETNSTGGQIIVDDIAEHSLYLNNVQANDVVVNDANGSNIVAQSGTQVSNLIVSEKAGAKGTVTLESSVASAFDNVTVSSNGSNTSNGINLKGDYSQSKLTVEGEGEKVTVAAGTKVKELEVKSKADISAEEGSEVTTVTVSANNKDEEIVLSGSIQKVVVTGEGGKVTIAAGATIKEIEVKSNATVSAEQGSTVTAVTIAADQKDAEITLSGALQDSVVTVQNANANITVPTGTVVGEIKKDTSVTGEVNIDNQGTIDKAAEGITVEGNKPVEVVPAPVVPPVTPPASGGGGGETPITFALSNIDATLSTGGSDTYSNNTVTLTGASTVNLTNISLTTNKPGFTVKLKSLTGSNGVTLPLSHSFTAGATSSVVSVPVNSIFPLVGSDGVSLGMLSRALGGGATISIDLIDGTNTPIAKSISLAISTPSGTLPTFVSNELFKFTRTTGSGTLADPEVVTASILNQSAKLIDMYNLDPTVNDATAFATIFTGLATVGLDTQVGFGDNTVSNPVVWYNFSDNAAVTNIKNMTGNKAWSQITFSDLNNDTIWFKTSNGKIYKLTFMIPS